MVDAAVLTESQDTTLTAQAPAKINLSLVVHGKRADGYHSLTSLVAGIQLFDELAFVPTKSTGVEIRCDDPAVPIDESNLAARAATALAERASNTSGVRIEIRKGIPMAAGLGGGSSDCATTLRVLNSLWALELTEVELTKLGAQIGSDVPLFFSMPTAVLTGRGEQIRPTLMRWSGWVVLALGGWTVSTHEVYANWRREDHCERHADAHEELIACPNASVLGPRLVNELEPAVFRTVPAVGAFQQALVDLTGHPWRISGAGSVAFALFDTEAEARPVAEAITMNGAAKEVAVVAIFGT